MKFFDLIRYAISNIWAQKLRTFLTILAITIGGLLMFLLPSLGIGQYKEMRRSFDSFGAMKSVYINPKYDASYSEALYPGFIYGEPNKLEDIIYTPAEIEEMKKNNLEAGGKWNEQYSKRILPEDLDKIEKIPGVKMIRNAGLYLDFSAMYFDKVKKYVASGIIQEYQNNQAYAGNESVITPAKDTIRFKGNIGLGAMRNNVTGQDLNFKIIAGRFLNNQDANTSNIIISNLFARGLQVADPNTLINTPLTITFTQLPQEKKQSDGVIYQLPSLTPIREQIKFIIVGVAAILNKDDLMNVYTGGGPNIIMPFHTAWEITKWQNLKTMGFSKNYSLESIEVVTTNNYVLESVVSELNTMKFDVQSDVQTDKEMKKFLYISLAVLFAVGLIALFVGALNIMNTMVMSVNERTKEIGILRSIGGSRALIRRVFFLESAVLGFLGGLSGIFWGWIISLPLDSYLVSKIGNSYSDAGPTGTPITASPTSMFFYSWYLIIGVIVFITLVGLIAGIIPAIRASRLNVIDSIRYE